MNTKSCMKYMMAFAAAAVFSGIAGADEAAYTSYAKSIYGASASSAANATKAAISNAVSATDAKGLDAKIATPEKFNSVFETATAAAAVLGDPGNKAWDATVISLMNASSEVADGVNAANGTVGDDAEDIVRKSYGLVAAAIANAVDDPKAVVESVVAAAPANMKDFVKRAVEDPVKVLGAASALKGKEIARKVRDAIAKDKAAADAEGKETVTVTGASTTTTTSTSTTTTTTIHIMKVNGRMVNPYTLVPIDVPPVVPTTKPSPTPVGRH